MNITIRRISMLNLATSMSSSLLGVSTGLWIAISVIALIVGAGVGILVYALVYKRTLKAAEQEKNKKKRRMQAF